MHKYVTSTIRGRANLPERCVSSNFRKKKCSHHRLMLRRTKCTQKFLSPTQYSTANSAQLFKQRHWIIIRSEVYDHSCNKTPCWKQVHNFTTALPPSIWILKGIQNEVHILSYTIDNITPLTSCKRNSLSENKNERRRKPISENTML